MMYQVNYETPWATEIERAQNERIKGLEAVVNRVLRENDSLKQENRLVREMLKRRDIRASSTLPEHVTRAACL